MIAHKAPRKPKKLPRSRGAEYRFVIDAYTPQTMPMARLVEYMRHLADMFGETAAVHFDRVEAGSMVVVSKIDHEAVPKVRQRVVSVRRGEGASDGLRAYRAINKLLREDNGIALLRDRPDGATIIRFPGREETEETFPAVREQGSIDGIIVRIGGKDETVHITLETEGGQVAGCFTNRAIGKQLGHKLFEPVRLFGRGRWSRDGDGHWALLDFKVESFESLAEVALSEALAGLRTIDIGWGGRPLTDLQAIRHGPPKNGGH